MSNIIEDFKKRDDIIKIYDFMKINKNLNNFHNRHIYTKVNFGADFNIDITSAVVSKLINELNQDLIQNVLKSMFNTVMFDYLDLRPDGSLMSGRVYLEKLAQMIYQSGYKNVVTTGHIASELMNSVYFSSNGKMLWFQHVFYNIGSLNGVSVWVDSYMKFNDGRLCL